MSFETFCHECFPGAHIMFKDTEHVVLGVGPGCVVAAAVGGEFVVTSQSLAQIPAVSITADNYSSLRVWLL